MNSISLFLINYGRDTRVLRCCLDGRLFLLHFFSPEFSQILWQFCYCFFLMISPSSFLCHAALDICSEFDGADTTSRTCQLFNRVSLHVYQKKFIKCDISISFSDTSFFLSYNTQTDCILHWANRYFFLF